MMRSLEKFPTQPGPTEPSPCVPLDNHQSLPSHVPTDNANNANNNNSLTQTRSLTESELEAENANIRSDIDFRAIIRCIQCPICFRPMRTPIRLPCNNWLCQKCLLGPGSAITELSARYPGGVDVLCPFGGGGVVVEEAERCGMLHLLDHCAVDISLQRVVDRFEVAFTDFCVSGDGVHDVSILVHVPGTKHSWNTDGIYYAGMIEPEGRLIGTYRLCEKGVLPYNAGVSFRDVMGGRYDPGPLNRAVLSCLRRSVAQDVYCGVCYSLLLDPCITSCGHSFCRMCFKQRQGNECHMCRGHATRKGTKRWDCSNSKLRDMIELLFPNKLRERELERKDMLGFGQSRVPIIHGLILPLERTRVQVSGVDNQRAALRCVNAGLRDFGVFPKGRARFNKYGCLVRVVGVHEDLSGLDLICEGISRIKLSGYYWRYRSGCFVGILEESENAVEPTPEENLAESTWKRFCMSNVRINGVEACRLSTTGLLEHAWKFCNPNELGGFPWPDCDYQEVMRRIGPPPATAEGFPDWFAASFAVPHEEQYRLLKTGSVRERLEIVIAWIVKIFIGEW
ncbi:hypothetical protein FQN53_007308 [Emmonsiellopsis sp. PD_33]|nr:hypothetical protein FQN53_007308 [Emmonsiellopsis sp. PD_33]